MNANVDIIICEDGHVRICTTENLTLFPQHVTYYDEWLTNPTLAYLHMEYDYQS